MAGETLRTYIKSLIDNRRLVDLTNDTSDDATPIDDNRLLACCQTAMGEFRWRSGHEPVETLEAHRSILKLGVLYILHESKLNNSSTADNFKKEFVLACKNFREYSVTMPKTSSKTTPTPEREGSRPDMDLNNVPLRGTRSRSIIPTDVNDI